MKKNFIKYLSTALALAVISTTAIAEGMKPTKTKEFTLDEIVRNSLYGTTYQHLNPTTGLYEIVGIQKDEPGEKPAPPPRKINEIDWVQLREDIELWHANNPKEILIYSDRPIKEFTEKEAQLGGEPPFIRWQEGFEPMQSFEEAGQPRETVRWHEGLGINPKEGLQPNKP